MFVTLAYCVEYSKLGFLRCVCVCLLRKTCSVQKKPVLLHLNAHQLSVPLSEAFM
jgi:hypothetical protein